MTGADYRIVYFSQSPFLGGRIPVAAVLRTHQGVKTVPAASLPLWSGKSGDDVNFLLRSALQDLSDRPNFEYLPTSLGPHFFLSQDVKRVPAKVADPDVWVRLLLSSPRVRTRNARRSKGVGEARQLLRQWGVDRFVHDHFEPKDDLLSDYSDVLQPVSQFVLGQQLLLLEPVHGKLDRRIQNVNTRFLAYKTALEKQPPIFKCTLISYVLPGPHNEARDAVVSQLARTADKVVDVSNEPQRRQFIETIQAAATA